MKIFALLFSFYLLGLFTVPCGDSIVLNKQNSASISYHQNHDHEQHHSDMCTPFCACNCCRVTSDIAFKSTFILPSSMLALPEIQYPSYKNSFISLNDKNIWQPPKITA